MALVCAESSGSLVVPSKDSLTASFAVAMVSRELSEIVSVGSYKTKPVKAPLEKLHARSRDEPTAQ